MQIPQWFALYTRPQMEDTARRLLQGKGYEVFLPSYKRRTARGKSIREVVSPLFPSYIFCRFTNQAGGQMITTPGVAAIVSFGGKPALIPEEEMEAVRKIVSSNVNCIPHEYVREGCRVRIGSGPLTSVEGVLLRTTKARRLVASIELLQRSVQVVLEPSWEIKVLGPSRPAAAQLSEPKSVA